MFNIFQNYYYFFQLCIFCHKATVHSNHRFPLENKGTMLSVFFVLCGYFFFSISSGKILKRRKEKTKKQKKRKREEGGEKEKRQECKDK